VLTSDLIWTTKRHILVSFSWNESIQGLHAASTTFVLVTMLCALILLKTLALYKPFTYLLTYLYEFEVASISMLPLCQSCACCNNVMFCFWLQRLPI